MAAAVNWWPWCDREALLWDGAVYAWCWCSFWMFTACVRWQQINALRRCVFTFHFWHIAAHIALCPLVGIWIPKSYLQYRTNNFSAIISIWVSLVTLERYFVVIRLSCIAASFLFGFRAQPLDCVLRCLCIGQQSECNFCSCTSMMPFCFVFQNFLVQTKQIQREWPIFILMWKFPIFSPWGAPCFNLSSTPDRKFCGNLLEKLENINW